MVTGSDTMFHEFSFQSPARRNPVSLSHQAAVNSQYSHPQNTQGVSTTDLSLLAQQFSQQSLRHDMRNTSSGYSAQTSTPYTANYPVLSPQHRSDCPHAATNVHSQHQSISRPQYQPSHAREANFLVERMIASGGQCPICSPETTHYNNSTNYTNTEDEGLGDMDDYDYLGEDTTNGVSQTLSYRRSSDFGSQHYVTRSIRVRKSKRQKSDQSRLR